MVVMVYMLKFFFKVVSSNRHTYREGSKSLVKSIAPPAIIGQPTSLEPQFLDQFCSAVKRTDFSEWLTNQGLPFYIPTSGANNCAKAGVPSNQSVIRSRVLVWHPMRTIEHHIIL